MKHTYMHAFLIKDKNIKIELSNEKIEINEGIYSFLITDTIEESFDLYINNDFYDSICVFPYITSINFINKLGYYEFKIVNKNNDIVYKFIIYTNTYKLQKDSFIDMLNFIEENALCSHGQFIYYNRNNEKCNIVTPVFVYNWINQNIDDIIYLIFRINSNYMKNIKTSSSKIFFNSSNYNNTKTLSFLKNNPNFMTEHSNGLITCGEKKYLPQALIKDYSEHDPILNNNIQILELITNIYNFCNKYLYDFKIKNSKDIKNNLVNWMSKISYIRNNTFLSQIPIQYLKNVKRYSNKENNFYGIEYNKLYNLYSDFLSIIYNLSLNEENYHQHIRNVDKIYESFCCYILADILNLKKVNDNILNNGLLFKNDSLKLFYQSKPSFMRGWAINDIPDIVLLDMKMNNPILILDSKFKIKKNSDIKTEDIQKMQAYLNNYSVKIGGILYPGDTIISIIDEINNIYEITGIPIYPWDSDLYKLKKNEIRLKIEKLMSKYN